MEQRTTEVRAVNEDLKTLFDYSYWANDRLCIVLSQLTTEQFTQPVAGDILLYYARREANRRRASRPERCRNTK